MLASPKQRAAQERAVAREDRQRQADRKPERQCGDADAHMIAEIIRQMRQRLAPARIGQQAHAVPPRQRFVQPFRLPSRRAQEFADILVAARGELGRRALRQQFARTHHRDAVGQQNRLGHVMGDHDRGQPELLVQLAIIVAQRVAGEGIERAERLVHQHDARLGGERPRHADALALPAGEFMGEAVAIGRALQPHQIEQFIDARGSLRGRPAEQLRRDADIVGDAHMRKQPAALEDIADAPPQPNRIGRAHVLALDRDVARVRLDQPVRQPQQRGLARAGAADNGEELALGHFERDVIHRQHAAAVEALGHICIGDQGLRGHFRRP